MNYLELSWPLLPDAMEAELLKLCLSDNEDCSEIYKNSKTLSQSDKEKRTFVSKNAAKKTNSQKWQCCETGYASTAAGVAAYQKARGIDTSKNNRRKIS